MIVECQARKKPIGMKYTLLGTLNATENVATSDDDANLHAQGKDAANFLCDVLEHIRIQAEFTISGQGFSGQLKKDSAKLGAGSGWRRSDHLNDGSIFFL